MAVITRTVWDYNAATPDGIDISTEPDPNAYGLTIVTSTPPNAADFYEGTCWINPTTKAESIKIGTAWVLKAAGVPPPAYAGPRSDAPTDAFFGRTDVAHGNLGIGMRSPNLIYVNIPGNGNFQVNPIGYSTQLQVVAGKVGLYPWWFGNHPTHGAPGIWTNDVDGTAGYSLLKYGNSLLLNGIDMTELRVNNATKLQCHTNGYIYLSSHLQMNSGQQIMAGIITANTVNSQGVAAAVDVSAQGRFWQQGDASHGPGWNQAHYVVSGAGYYGARVALNYGGAAMQMRVGQWKGEAMEFVASDSSVYRWIYASAFQVESTITAKKDVRSVFIMPGERTRVEYDPFLDEVPDIDVMALRPVAFRPKIAPPAWDPETETFIEQTHPVWRLQDRRERIGLIAEEVQHVIPSAVGHNEDGSAGGIDYAQVTVALLGHVQQLTATIETLKYRITELEATRG